MKRNSSEEDTSVSKQKTKSNASLIKEKWDYYCTVKKKIKYINNTANTHNSGNVMNYKIYIAY